MTLSVDLSLVLRGGELDLLPAVVVGDDHTPQRAMIAAEDHAAALAEAYQAGFAAGSQSARAEVGTATAALGRAVDRVEALEQTLSVEAIEQVIGLGLELTEALLQRELTASRDPGAEAIARTLAQLPRQEALSFRLNPQDLVRLGEIDSFLADRPHQLISDPTLASGDVVVDYASGTIDGRLSSALQRVRELMNP